MTRVLLVSSVCSDSVAACLFARVCRTAAPLQFLMFLLLGVACLVPLAQQCEEDFNCITANNLHRSFSPMLTHTDGMPPF